MCFFQFVHPVLLRVLQVIDEVRMHVQFVEVSILCHKGDLRLGCSVPALRLGKWFRINDDVHYESMLYVE